MRLSKNGLKAVGVLAGAICSVLASQANAAVSVTVDPAAGWQGFMNVFELPANGGGYVFGSSWGVPDLRATFAGPVLTLAPNTIGDTSNFWYQGPGTNPGGPGAPGNKVMDANMYIEYAGGTFPSGDTLTFTGIVTSNTLASGYTSVAFIKDFAPDYSSNVAVTVALTPGTFSISLPTINDPARHIQFGFETIGANVWATDADPFGSVSIVAVPEPASIGVLAGAGLLALRRRRA